MTPPPRRVRKTRPALLLVPILALSGALRASADTVVLEPVADTSILEEGFPVDPIYNLGGENRIPSGARGSMDGIDGAACRILVAFSLADRIPPGSTISAARLRMTVVRVPETGRRDSVFALRRLFRPWTEGTGTGSDPGGRQALAGEATWNAARHDQLPWTAPGGAEGVDFRASPSTDPTTVRGAGTYTFDFNAQGLADLADMAARPGCNFGWMFLTESETIRKTARQFASREDALASRRPQLEIDFTPPGVPSDPPELDPAPNPPEVLGLELSDTAEAATIFLHGQPGHRYHLESSTNLSAPDWDARPTFLDVLPVENPGPRFLSTPVDGDSRRFFRILAHRLLTDCL